MKKLMLSLTLGLLMVSMSSCDKDIIMPSEKVPNEITNFIDTHFPTYTILQVIKDLEGLNKSYDVVLSEGVSLEFNRKKEIREIKANTQLPDSVIPTKILEYVNQNFPANFIIEWELEDRHQQVGLDNDLDLEFTMKGDFLRIDD